MKKLLKTLFQYLMVIVLSLTIRLSSSCLLWISIRFPPELEYSENGTATYPDKETISLSIQQHAAKILFGYIIEY